MHACCAVTACRIGVKPRQNRHTFTSSTVIQNAALSTSSHPTYPKPRIPFNLKLFRFVTLILKNYAMCRQRFIPNPDGTTSDLQFDRLPPFGILCLSFSEKLPLCDRLSQTSESGLTIQESIIEAVVNFVLRPMSCEFPVASSRQHVRPFHHRIPSAIRCRQSPTELIDYSASANQLQHSRSYQIPLG